MKVAILSESPADEAGIHILVEGLLGTEVELARKPRLRTRGWPSILDSLPAVIRHLHYRTDTDALVFVADSNHSPAHQGGPATLCPKDPKCRLCQIQEAVRRAQTELSPVSGKDPIKIAVGLAVPAIEAWYLCGKTGINELAWIEGPQNRSYPYTKNQLKKWAYGTDRPGIPLETERAIAEATRLAENLDQLERAFPLGFGSLARGIRNW